jgi:hypothetical protein
LLDVLGRSVIQRAADRLRHHRIAEITAVVDTGYAGACLLPRAGGELVCLTASGPSFWEATQRVFSSYAQAGADLVLLVRLGPYTEIDYDELIQAHLDRNARITTATDETGQPLGTFAISASRRNDAAFLLRHRLLESRTPLSAHCFIGYWNPLATPADLRRLAVDAFAGRAGIMPEASEIRPGVWLAKGARVHSGARVVAPAFVGRAAKVRFGAVVTRCSVIEHHAIAGRGTVLEDVSLLPHTSLGRDLDVAHAVVGLGRVYDLRRGLEVVTADPRLVGAARSAPGRLLARARTQLASRFPFHSWDGLRRRVGLQPANVRASGEAPVAALAGSEPLPGRSIRD